MAADVIVRGSVDRHDTVVVAFEDLPDGGWIRANGDTTDDVVAYFSREAYRMQTQPAESMASFAAFAKAVTLMGDAIVFGDPFLHGASGVFADAPPCRQNAVAECTFTARGGTESKFTVSVARGHHTLPRAHAKEVVVGHGEGAVTIDTANYNSYVEDAGATMPGIALSKTRLALHYNGTHYFLLTSPSGSSPSSLVSMAIMLMGGIIFIPNSVTLTKLAISTPRRETEMVALVGGLGNVMHIVVADFAFSAVTILAFFVHENGLGMGTFRTTPNLETSAEMDIVVLVNCAAAACIAVWASVTCRAAVETATHDKSAFSAVHAKLAAVCDAAGFGGAASATATHAVMARGALEYTLIVTFMAACPYEMGPGFVRCAFLLSAMAMTFVLFRDTALVLAMNEAEVGWGWRTARRTAWVVPLCGTAPLAYYGFLPIVEDSRSFPTTTGATWSVAAGTLAVVMATAVRKGKSRLPARPTVAPAE